MKNGPGYFIGSQDLAGVHLITIYGTNLVDIFPELYALIQQRCGPDVAALFAEPRLSRGNGAAASRIDWYGPFEGSAKPVDDLDSSSARSVIRLFEQRIAGLRALTEDEGGDPRIAAMLNILSQHSLVSISGQPVLRDWGMVPETVGDNAAAQADHFAAVLGCRVPDLRPPVGSLMAWEGRVSAASAESPTSKARHVSGGSGGAPPGPGGAGGLSSPGWPVRGDRFRCLLGTSLCLGVLLLVTFLPGLLAFPWQALGGPEHERALAVARGALDGARERLAMLDRQLALDCPALMEARMGGVVPPASAAQVTVSGPSHDPASSSTEAPPGTTDLVERADSGVVLVVSDDGGTGTGFFITPELLVTNQHVTSGARTVKVVSKAIGIVEAEVIREGSGNYQDFALLKVARQAKARPFAVTTTAKRLQNAVAVGFPGLVMGTDVMFQKLMEGDVLAAGQLTANFTQGAINHLQTQQSPPVTLVVHGADISPGNSGGPLLDLCGRVIGVNTFGLSSRDMPVVARYALGVDGLVDFLGEGQGDVPLSLETGECHPSIAESNPGQIVSSPTPPSQQQN